MTAVTDRDQFDANARDACARACFEAVCASTAYADACLSQPAATDHAPGLRAALDFVDASGAAWRVLTRADADRQAVRALLRACVTAARACAEACARCTASPAQRERCVEAARRCAEACRTFVAAHADAGTDVDTFAEADAA
jgi:hypothetical protein